MTRPHRQEPIVAIDGPAGSGKSTVARALANRLGYVHVDTGALYRAVAFLAVRQKLRFADEAVKRADGNGIDDYGEQEPIQY